MKNKMCKCLFCYNQLEKGQVDYHPTCSKKMFDRKQAPELTYTEDQMLELADKVIKSQVSVTGVQPKLSLEIEKISNAETPQRFTIVGLWGSFILKPPTKLYPHLPELEDVTMHLAELSGIKTVPHSLIRLKTGKLSYITRRVDRIDSKKIHMEDMCQITEKLTEQKYRGSYEQIGKAIIKYSADPILDIINFFEQVLFCFLTGNADMHLKNFSLIKRSRNEYVLSPAYDMVASALIVKGDDEDFALTLNGKKKNISRNDFNKALGLFNIDVKVKENIFKKFARIIPGWTNMIEISFLPNEMKEKYKEIVYERTERMQIFN